MARPKSPPRVNGPYPDRGGTRFRVRIFDRGRRKDLYFRSEKDALECVAEAQRGLSTASSRAISDLIDEYMREKEHLGRAKAETCADQRERVRWFLRAYLDDDIGTLTPKRASALYQEIIGRTSQKTGKPMAAASHRHYLALTKGFFLWAVRVGHLERNPFKEVQPIGRVSAGKPQLRIEEAKHFIDTALQRFDLQGDAMALGAAVALLMGLRASEVLSRQGRDVDRSGQILWIDTGKTRNARRFLDVPTVLQTRLQSLASQGRPDELLFGTNRVGKPRTRQVLWQAVHGICDAAGVPRVCPHSLRGLWATLGVQAGAVSHAVAASLGHGSFSMTEKHYAQPEAVRGARTARMVDMLNLGEISTADPRASATQLLKQIPPEVLEQLVSLHRGEKT